MKTEKAKTYKIKHMTEKKTKLQKVKVKNRITDHVKLFKERSTQNYHEQNLLHSTSMYIHKVDEYEQ